MLQSGHCHFIGQIIHLDQARILHRNRVVRHKSFIHRRTPRRLPSPVPTVSHRYFLPGNFNPHRTKTFCLPINDLPHHHRRIPIAAKDIRTKWWSEQSQWICDEYLFISSNRPDIFHCQKRVPLRFPHTTMQICFFLFPMLMTCDNQWC